jgi:hypothetical protein
MRRPFRQAPGPMTLSGDEQPGSKPPTRAACVGIARAAPPSAYPTWSTWVLHLPAYFVPARQAYNYLEWRGRHESR